MNIKKIICPLLFAIIFGAYNTYAAVLGDVSDSVYNDMGAYSSFHKTQFDGGNAGRQTDYYVEYAPNSEATPIIVNGGSLWGTLNMNTANTYVEGQGNRALAAVNADFFSFKTGLQMGYTISGGRLISKDLGPQPAIGFREDGSSFIDTLDVKTTAYKGDMYTEIQYINKWCQKGFDPIYMLTSDFGESTKTESKCIFIMCDVIEGSFAVSGDTKLRAYDGFVYEGAIKIPEGKVILLMDETGTPECRDFLSSIQAGDEITIHNEVLNSEKNQWSTASEATSTTGARLLKDGSICSFSHDGANPRTAVGIKENGNLIMYALDGRQSGYSYGCRLETLAKRMAELGCVDAINLDGGGSTTFGAHMSGTDNFEVKNSPSDGYLRRVSNFIFLRDNRQPTNVGWIINAGLESENYLKGSTGNVNIGDVFDTANYKMTSYTPKITCDKGTVSENTVTFTESGTANIEIDINGGTKVLNCNVYDSPEEIRVYLKDNMSDVTAVYADAHEELELDLTAVGYVGGNEIKSDSGCVEWSISNNIGTISNGYLVLNDVMNADGVITVKMGSCVKEIPVTVGGSSFNDIKGHWAENTIEALAADGIIKGIETDKGMSFFPDNSVTRAEFAVIMSRFLKIDESEYENTASDFLDENEIPSWAKNAVRAMYNKNIISGKPCDTGILFDPQSSLTRAEAITIIGRMFDEDAPAVNYADSEYVPQWAVDGINKLSAKGIIQGYGDNTIRPNQNVSRAEAAAMLYKCK